MSLSAALLLGTHSADSFANNAGNATVYFNGDILTMEGAKPEYAGALVEQDGNIVFTGSRRVALARYPAAIRRDLKGQTLVPGFVDGHGHIYLMGLGELMANVRPAPDGPGADFASLIRTTKAWSESDTGKFLTSKTGWIVANGYDESLLQEKTAPTADVLDQISKDVPVLLIHQSGHVGAMNHKGLEMAGFNRDTLDPAGGVVRRKADGSPDGVVEESALTKVVNAILFRGDPDIDKRAIALGQEAYIKYGYTTAQDGRTFPNMAKALSQAASGGLLQIDVVSYPDIIAGSGEMASAYYRADRAYTNNYRIGGVKISLDGSPQAKTAWLTHPYHIPPPHKGSDYVGYAALPEAKALELFEQAASKRWQVLCHANGDAAIDQCLNGVAKAQAKYPGADHRSVLIHGQTLRKDQVGRLARQKMLPSLFPSHTYYWGDYHRDSVLGGVRADRISPTRDVINAGMTLTSHHDAPVVLPNAMRVLDATVNRVTRSGQVLGPSQRLTPYEGLKALTIWGAIQHFEESNKGTLRAGKRADLAILSANPLKVARRSIKEIRVVATIKRGKQLYCAAPIGLANFCETTL